MSRLMPLARHLVLPAFLVLLASCRATAREAPPVSAAPPAVGGGTTFLQAKTANEVLKAQERNYGILEDLNTRPRTTYLAAVRNPHPSLPTHTSVGGHTEDHSSGASEQH